MAIFVSFIPLQIECPFGYIPCHCLPDAAAIISVEVVGQFLPAVHASFFYGLRETQGPVFEGLHGLLDQFYVATSTCPISLWDKNRDTNTPQ